MSQPIQTKLGSYFNGPGAPKSAHPESGDERPQLKPLIAKILHSQDCTPGSVFLVEKIDAVTKHIAAAPQLTTATTPRQHGATQKRQRRRSWHLRGVRLLLADGGGVCIQGLIRPVAHELVHEGLIYEGSFVRLDDFWLCVVQPDTSSAETRPTVFLVIEHVTPLSNPRPRAPVQQVARPPNDGAAAPQRRATVSPRNLPAAAAGQKQKRRQPLPVAGFLSDAVIRDAPPPPPPPAVAQFPDVVARPADDGPQQHITSNQAYEKAASRDPAAQRRQGAAAAPPIRGGTPPAWACHDLSRPLKLTPLRAIRLLPFKQNWMVNVLAVVVELSAPEPSLLPPSYTQRTARLADPSTGKRVLLTVFLDPDEFEPSAPVPGAVVLLLGVKNHQFDGGSLKKYASDKPRDGGPWWLEAPRHLPWCDVAGLEAWWAAKVEEEEQEQEQEQEHEQEHEQEQEQEHEQEHEQEQEQQQDG